MRAATSLLIAVLLCLAAAAQTASQRWEDWTWKDRDGKIRLRADLDKSLEQHKLLVEAPMALALSS